RLAARPSRPADDPLRRLELRQTVEQLLRRLSPEDRVLLTLKEMEGFSTREIADLLKLKENTVKVRLFRVRKRLLEIHRRLRKRERGRGA
ncbi:MAG: sigma-70 family RNA polymerase sigma factor, partial [Acidobacteria bacterium]|nr:sigma-70 family RNA polymerase sigma factor [Acidobacteriota bacterium]